MRAVYTTQITPKVVHVSELFIGDCFRVPNGANGSTVYLKITDRRSNCGWGYINLTLNNFVYPSDDILVIKVRQIADAQFVDA